MGRKQVMKWRKNNTPEEGGQREHRDDRKDIEIHAGSYPIDEVKAMPEYAELVEQTASKRTYALNIGYCGSSYQGLQTNEGAITIEGLLERALFLSGGIKECNFGNLQKVGWTRAARTDNQSLKSCLHSQSGCLHHTSHSSSKHLGPQENVLDYFEKNVEDCPIFLQC